VARLLEAHVPSRLPGEVQRELTRLMQSAARAAGMDALPSREA